MVRVTGEEVVLIKFNVSTVFEVKYYLVKMHLVILTHPVES